MSISNSYSNASHCYKNTTNSNKTATKDKQKQETPEELREEERHRAKLIKSGRARKMRKVNFVAGCRMEVCGSYLEFDKFQNIMTGDLMRSLTYGNFCRCYKFCPVCSWHYSVKTSADFLGRLMRMQRERKAEGLKPYRLVFLTLTVRNCPLDELRETLRAMSKSWDRLARTKRFRQAIQGGWFRGVEYLGDETDAGEAHPHYHVLLVVTESYFKKHYIKQEEWADMWRDALRVDYDPIVHIERIKPRLRTVLDNAGNAAEKVQSATSAAAHEVCKYSVAPTQVDEMSDEDFKVLYEQTFRGRQYAMGGRLKDTEPDPPQDLDREVWRYLGAEVWRWCMGQYMMTQFSEVHNNGKEF